MAGDNQVYARRINLQEGRVGGRKEVRARETTVGWRFESTSAKIPGAGGWGHGV